MLLESSHFAAGLGHIPTDWRVKTVNEISLKITKGTTPPKEDIVEHREIPFLRVNNLGFNGVLDQKSDFIFVSRKAHEGFLARSKAYPGDIVMNIVGPPLGKVSLLGNDFAEYNMNQAIVIYRLQDDVIYRDYFLAYLLSDIAQQWLQSRSKKTSGQQNLTIELCKGLPVPIPTFVEQKKIAQILSTWDQAIATTERLLDLARQQKKALMQQLLTGKKRFPGFERTWKSGVLSDVANIDSGFAFRVDDFSDESDTVPIIRMSDLKSGNLDLSRSARVVAKALVGLDKFALKSDEFVFGMSGSLTNYAWVKANDLPCYLNQRVGRIVAKDDADQLFVSFLYLSDHIQHTILAKAAGAAQLNISVTDLRSISIKYPCSMEQKKIASVLSTSDKEIETLLSQLNGLKQEKKALMQALLTGKRRVQL